MHITEVKIELVTGEPRLLAFAKVIFDGCFVIHDVKVIQTDHGLLVAMPAKKIEDHCPDCQQKNHLRAKFCGNCGIRLADDRAPKAEDGRSKLFADVAHPICPDGRHMIDETVLDAYRQAQWGAPASEETPATVAEGEPFGIGLEFATT